MKDTAAPKCPRCRKLLATDWAHCPYCGANSSLEPSDITDQIYPEKGVFDLFLHSTRREIYQLICDLGSSKLVEIMKNTTENITETAVKWHLDKLINAGLVKTMHLDDKSHVYYPALLRSDEVELAISVLKNDTRKRIFRFIIEHDGCKKTDIANGIDRHRATVTFHITRMINADLIREQRVTKNLNRYTLGDLGKKIVEGSVNCIGRSYINFLLDKIEETRPCVPRIEKQTLTELQIAVSSKYSNQDVIISINLGKWDFWEDEFDDLDVGTIQFILGEGGIELLEALAREETVAKVQGTLTLPDSVFHAKLSSLEKEKLVKDGKITLRGKRVAKRIVQIA